MRWRKSANTVYTAMQIWRKYEDKRVYQKINFPSIKSTTDDIYFTNTALHTCAAPGESCDPWGSWTRRGPFGASPPAPWPGIPSGGRGRRGRSSGGSPRVCVSSVDPGPPPGRHGAKPRPPGNGPPCPRSGKGKNGESGLSVIYIIYKRVLMRGRTAAAVSIFFLC